jgi:ketosteroid isomerase-like protein
MSEENVEIVRAALDAWDRGDRDAAFKHAAPKEMAAVAEKVRGRSRSCATWREHERAAC